MIWIRVTCIVDCGLLIVNCWLWILIWSDLYLMTCTRLILDMLQIDIGLIMEQFRLGLNWYWIGCGWFTVAAGEIGRCSINSRDGFQFTVSIIKWNDNVELVVLQVFVSSGWDWSLEEIGQDGWILSEWLIIMVPIDHWYHNN